MCLKNIYMGPKIQKVILNMGLGLDGNDSKVLKSCEEDLAKITGQKPVITKFKKSVKSAFQGTDPTSNVAKSQAQESQSKIDRYLNKK